MTAQEQLHSRGTCRRDPYDSAWGQGIPIRYLRALSIPFHPLPSFSAWLLFLMLLPTFSLGKHYESKTRVFFLTNTLLAPRILGYTSVLLQASLKYSNITRQPRCTLGENIPSWQTNGIPEVCNAVSSYLQSRKCYEHAKSSTDIILYFQAFLRKGRNRETQGLLCLSIKTKGISPQFWINTHMLRSCALKSPSDNELQNYHSGSCYRNH